MINGMAKRAIEIGPTGRTVAANLARLRGLRGLTLAGLSARLDAVGRPLAGSAVSAIENLDRRCDVDDLVALAAALDVSPAALLCPPPPTHDDDEEGLTHPVVTSAAPRPVALGALWLWLNSESPLANPAYIADPIDVEMWRRAFVPRFDRRTPGSRDG